MPWMGSALWKGNSTAVGYGIAENGGWEGGRHMGVRPGVLQAEGAASPKSTREELQLWLEQGEPRAEWKVMMEREAAGQVMRKDLGFSV